LKHITSRDNPLYKRLKALAGSSQQQRRDGLALLEGLHLARAWLDTLGQPRTCVVTQGALQLAEARDIVDRVEPARTVVLADALFGPLSLLANGVGLLFLVDAPRPVAPERVEETCVILDGVQDAGNVGSILRSAAAAGIRQVFCGPGTASVWSGKVLRAGMGAHFLLAIHEGTAAHELGPRLAIPAFVTDSHASITLHDCDLARPVAWIFGNEGAGVSALWQAIVDTRVTIPQPGGLESLNVAAAAAVCLFEQCRQIEVAARAR
jgi:TrmH family RNA methyltransferase